MALLLSFIVQVIFLQTGKQNCATKYRYLVLLKLKIKLALLPLFSFEQVLKKHFSVIPLDIDSYINVFKVFVVDWRALLTFLTWPHSHVKEEVILAAVVTHALLTLKFSLFASINEDKKDLLYSSSHAANMLFPFFKEEKGT